MKYIREELQNIKESLQTIECELGELDCPKIEEGQYWKWHAGRVFRVQAVHTETKRCRIRYLNGVEKDWYWNGIIEDAKLLSDSEVEQSLIEEFEKRYSIGDVVEHWLHPVLHNGRKGKRDIPDIEDFEYSPSRDVLSVFYGDGGGEFLRVYKKGEWAEIIEEKWKVTSTGYYVTNGIKTVRFHNPDEEWRDGFTTEQAKAIAEALNDLED